MKALLSLVLLTLAAGLVGSPPAHGQCSLANPSFELPGSGGAAFGGWNQFGVVSSTADAAHGAVAARISGPNSGSWGLSAVWQPQDCVPGERWRAAVSAWHASTAPLTGESRAILNIEWRDAAGELLDFESHVVVEAATAVDEVQARVVESAPAPVGTAQTRLLVGTLQAPGEPSTPVHFDLARFESLGPPTPEELQWDDFPGGRTLEFGGRTWRVKGPGFYGPGPNVFDDGVGNVWVDGSRRLHLTVRNLAGTWTSTEVTLEEPLGYGDYVFTTHGRLDTLHHNVVLGLFLWEYGPCYDLGRLWWNPYNEIDIEFSRWGNPANAGAQFVAQPWDFPGNLRRFDATFQDDEITSHAMRWLPDRVEYRSWRGGPQDEPTGEQIFAWTYTGPHVPRPDRPRVHVNLWKLQGDPDGDQEVVLDDFTFVPACLGPGCEEPPTAAPVATATLGLRGVWPNPFRGGTTVALSLERGGAVELDVFDLAGRRVRRLARRVLPPGEDRIVWDGTDDAGRSVASGVYLVRLRMGQQQQTVRAALLR